MWSSMWGLGLWFVLLLPQLDICTASEVSVTKTIGREADVTPLCSNKTLDAIILVVCQITTKRNGGQECTLLYDYEHGINDSCGPRFSLLVENDTVFLHLHHLTPSDGGNYTCECSSQEGTEILHFSVSVEGYANSEEGNSVASIFLCVTAIAAVIATGGIIYGILRHHGFDELALPCRAQSLPERLNGLLTKEEPDIEPYSTFMQRENDLYSTRQLNYPEPCYQ